MTGAEVTVQLPGLSLEGAVWLPSGLTQAGFLGCLSETRGGFFWSVAEGCGAESVFTRGLATVCVHIWSAGGGTRPGLAGPSKSSARCFIRVARVRCTGLAEVNVTLSQDKLRDLWLEGLAFNLSLLMQKSGVPFSGP